MINKLEAGSEFESKIPKEEDMKSISKESARKLAHDLFTKSSYQCQRVDLYVDPDTGEIEAIRVGEFPSEGWEYVGFRNDPYIYYGQEFCEDDIEECFEVWATEHLEDFIEELENAWLAKYR